MSKKPAPKPEQKKKRPPYFIKGRVVYFTAFQKQDKNKFFLCKGEIEKIPAKGEKPAYKVKITAVSGHAIGHKDEFTQSALLGKTITKKFKELHRELQPFLAPRTWIEVTPGK